MEKSDFFNKKLYIFYIIIGVSFSLLLVYFWNLTVDDAFISFRYALHLAEGYGMVWNIGEPPIEGYSNFLWVLLLSFLMFFKLDTVLMSKIVNLCLIIGILFFYWKFTKDLFSNQNKNVIMGWGIAILLFLVNPATAIHTISGMETIFFSFLLLALMFYSYKIINSPENRYFWLFGVFAILLSLLRPEGILITFSLLLLFILYNYKKDESFKIDISIIIPIFSLFLIPLALYMIFRYQYFHDIFPMTYHAKYLSGNILSMISYNLSWILDLSIYHIMTYILVNLLFIILYKLFLPDLSFRKKYFKIIIIFLFIAVAANITYLTTKLAMNYGDRLFYPTYVIIYLITGISLTFLYGNKDLYKLKIIKKIKLSKNILLTAIIVLLLISNFSFMISLIGWHDYGNKEYNTQVAVGLALEPFSPYNYTVATDYAGAIPYYSRWRHIDMLGLNNKYIAENKNASQDYLQKVKPDLIIIPYLPNGDITNEDFKPFLEYAQQNNYTLIKLPWENFKYYLNPKISHFNEIKQSLINIKYQQIMF